MRGHKYEEGKERIKWAIEELRKFAGVSFGDRVLNSAEIKKKNSFEWSASNIDDDYCRSNRTCSPKDAFELYNRFQASLEILIEQVRLQDTSKKVVNEARDVMQTSLNAFREAASEKLTDCIISAATQGQKLESWKKHYLTTVVESGLWDGNDRLDSAFLLEDEKAIDGCLNWKNYPQKDYNAGHMCGMIVNLETCEIRSAIPHRTHEYLFGADENPFDHPSPWRYVWNVNAYKEDESVPPLLQFGSPVSYTIDKEKAIKATLAVAKCLCENNKTGKELYISGTPSYPLDRPTDVCKLNEQVVKMLFREVGRRRSKERSDSDE